MEPVSVEQIAITPGTCGGRPRIAGHRIAVQNIVVWHDQMLMDPVEIAATYPTITLADGYAALASYHDHREAIDARIKADDDFVEEMRLNASPSRYQPIGARRHAE